MCLWAHRSKLSARFGAKSQLPPRLGILFWFIFLPTPYRNRACWMHPVKGSFLQLWGPAPHWKSACVSWWGELTAAGTGGMLHRLLWVRLWAHIFCSGGKLDWMIALITLFWCVYHSSVWFAHVSPPLGWFGYFLLCFWFPWHSFSLLLLLSPYGETWPSPWTSPVSDHIFSHHSAFPVTNKQCQQFCSPSPLHLLGSIGTFA